MELLSLDFNVVDDCRLYIQFFRKNLLPGTDTLTLSSGRVLNLDDLSDDDAVAAAHMLRDLEEKAEELCARKSGRIH